MLKGFPERGHALYGEFFGASRRRNGRLREGFDDLGRLKARGAQIFAQSFSLLCEGLSEKWEKCLRLNTELCEARTHGKAQYGGMHLRRGHECGRRQSKNSLDARIHLSRDRERAIVVRTRRGDDPIRNFPLHHDYGVCDGVAIAEQMQQNWRSDVVGKIAYDVQFVTAASQSIEVNGEDVSLYHFNCRDLGAQANGEIVVELDGDEELGARSKDFGDGSGAGANFNDGLMRYVA